MPTLHEGEPKQHQADDIEPSTDDPEETPDGDDGRLSRLKEAAWTAAYIAHDLIEWLLEAASAMADYQKERKDKRLQRRHEAFTKRVVSEILTMPEFSHSVRVHGSAPFVSSYLKQQEGDTLQYHADRYEDLRSKVYLWTPLALFPAAYFVLIGQKLPGLWGENDRKSSSEFPSTRWLEELIDPLGTEGVIAAGSALSILFAAALYGGYVEIRGHFSKFPRVRAEAKSALLPHVRVALNAWSDQESPTELKFEQAPALSSSADRQYLIEREEIDRIATLVQELGASAVAISGPRGAGKSTLLRSIASSEYLRGSLCISLEAPTSYEARDFVITLYRQICEQVISTVSGMTDSPSRKAGRFAFTAVRILLGSLVIAIALTQWQPAQQFLRFNINMQLAPANLLQAGSYAALLIALYVLVGKLRPYRGLAGATELVARAIREEERLRFLQNVAVERSGTLKAKVGLELGRKRTRQLLEQPTSLPDLVRSYRSFAEDSLIWWRRFWTSGHLVIIIDELDRVTEVEAAERFINDVKGIFGIRHCTYLVTVSEDALSQFERRMVGIRPVLDSTFDEVVRLPVLDFVQAKELLERRLVGLPHAFIALCHALSGGIPRDLIRAARTLIDLRRTTRQVDLCGLTHGIVLQEVGRLKSGLIGRVNNDLAGSAAFRLLRILADPEWPAPNETYMLNSASELIRQGEVTEDDERVSTELGVALYYYGTILQVFADFEADSVKDFDRLAKSAQSLAVARSVMPASVELAYVHLQRLREEECLN
ncbi:P-loop NTPase fold protein [Micromonospora sp. C81]|uniref:P-loop NTPase fold protein n=1 Tax=Micromonospora sp. C81 TaxID=2824881 RepID=UPI001B3959E8|nr:P-loop NTPase fold protein [Micromonospora sp. C81]MBQ1037560.1 hypothetical protein [Micromonospora sp. C81]